MLTLLFGMLAGFGVARAHAYIYYPDNDNGHSWGRANLDGSNANDTFFHNGFGLGASDGSHLYWMRAGTTDAYDYPNLDGGIDVSNLDGTGMHEIISGVAAEGLAIDSSHIYFISYTGDGVHNTIARANLDGSGLDRTFIDAPAWSNSDDGGPEYITLNGGLIYWYDHNRIGRATVDGSGVDDSFIPGTGGGLTYGFTTDGSHLFWTIAWGGEVGSIARVNSDGTAMNKYFVPNTPLPQGLSVADGYFYWTQGVINHRSIRRARLDGTGIQTVVNASSASFVLVDPLGPGGGGAGKGSRCVVPPLRGMTIKAARAKLRKAHCAVGRITRNKAKGRAGRVTRTRPASGAVLATGSKVNLVVRRR